MLTGSSLFLSQSLSGRQGLRKKEAWRVIGLCARQSLFSEDAVSCRSPPMLLTNKLVFGIVIYKLGGGDLCNINYLKKTNLK
jgi:hypothetical protein